MRRALLVRIVGLLAVLGLLTWGASILVVQLTRTWFERDVDLRLRLAVNGARRALVADWTNEDALLRELEDVVRDKRIRSMAACSMTAAPLAHTSEHPASLGCREVLEKLDLHDPAELSDGASTPLNDADDDLVVGAVLVRNDAGGRLGYVTVVHDLGFAARRGTTTRIVYLVTFGVLALLTAFATAIFERRTLRALRNEIRRWPRGGHDRTELAPLLRDVRDLAERLAEESGTRPALGWTKRRLKETLQAHLEGDRVIVVANRQPYVHQKAGDRVEVLHPASGLVTALEPVMRACSGVWVAHGNGSADRETSDARGRVWVPPGERLYTTRRVWLTDEEEQGYYYGFSNEALWPLCHLADARPAFRAADFEAYRRVNQKFAEAVSEEADGDDPIVLVQDYHFALAPRMVRDRIPEATVLTFWHIPWPNAERFGICPQHEELLRGMLGSSIVGFHTQNDCNNFLAAVDRYLEARIDRERDAVKLGGRWTLVRPYPISIEWPNRWLSDAPSVEECGRMVRAAHGIAPHVRLGVGVDRIDYTKGIEERLLAVERLFERRPDLAGTFTFVQLGAPSRTKLPAYRDLAVRVEALGRRINERFGTEGWSPIVLSMKHHEPDVVTRYYRAASLCYVSSLHDGMNLVAKEYVSSRDDEQGVLVLSRFTGAAREMTEALVVNPYDVEEASEALEAALAMSPDEQTTRMRALRALVAEWNVYRWAGRMLLDASRLRRNRRLAGRLGESSSRLGGPRSAFLRRVV